MKKRILSCLMALALSLTLLPATAQAADAEQAHTSHCLCGAEHDNNIKTHEASENTTFATAKWMASYTGKLGVESFPGSSSSKLLPGDDNYVILETGYYYLSNTADNCDKLSYVGSLKTIKIQGDVTICLNGKQIQKVGTTAGSVFEVPSGSTLTLTDCTGNGQIMCDSSNGSGVYVNGGILNLYSGQITKSEGQKGTDYNKYGGGVYVNNGGTFNMYGGVITRNSADYGGGVYVKSGTFNMYGGTITKNTSSGGYGTLGFGGAGVYVEASGNFIMNNDASVTENTIGYGSTGGAGVYVNGGTFKMYDNASVTGNKADNSSGSSGGGVYVNSGTFTMNGNASVTGNKAKNGTHPLNGGGVYVNGGTFEMNNNASVTGNAASGNKASQGNGGGVYVKSGTFNMNGGAISGNKATNSKPENTTYGGGVYVNGGTFTMNGEATSVSNNTAKNGGGVHVSGGKFNMNDKASIKSNTGNGVFVNGGTFTVSDTPTVTENTMNGDASNVYLDGSAYITIGSKLNVGASIGVTKTTGVGSVIATGSKDLTEADAAKFKSDMAGFAVSVDKDKTTQLVLKKVETQPSEHKHEWSYQNDGNATIKAVCKGTGVCDVYNNDGGSVTIKAPEHKTYGDGKSAEAQLTQASWQGERVNVGNIQYSTQNGNALSDAPTEVGKYKASITVGGKTASVEYEITGGTPEIVPVSQITLNKTSTSISVGNSETLTATVAPENAANKDLKWASSDTSVATVAADGTVTAVKAGTATITATAADGSGKSATCTVTVTGGTTPSQPGGSTGGSSSGGGGGSSSDRDSSDSNPVIKTETKNNADGSTTKTETRRDGSVTQTTTAKDGSVSKTETKKDGSSVTETKAADGSTGTVKTDKNGQTEAKTALSSKAIEDAKKNGEAVKAPVEVKASHDSSTAPTVKVELPKGAGETKVEIPVSNVKPGTVAVLVHPDGTEEILKNSIPTEDGIQLTVDGNATVKIIDNSKDFIDTRNHWAKDAIDFVSARGLVNGMSATIYAPNASTTRAQLWTILARQNDADLSGGSIWYEKAQNWAKDKGVSDGANPNAAINRAQMVTMLWRAVGQPTAGSAANFTDVSADSYYAGAVSWAVENGITTGVGGGRFDPAATCTRAQIAAFLARLYAEK